MLLCFFLCISYFSSQARPRVRFQSARVGTGLGCVPASTYKSRPRVAWAPPPPPPPKEVHLCPPPPHDERPGIHQTNTKSAHVAPASTSHNADKAISAHHAIPTNTADAAGALAAVLKTLKEGNVVALNLQASPGI